MPAMPASHILMIRPVNFGYNAETAVNNAFQVAVRQEGVQKQAQKEFDDFVEKLRSNGIDVTVIEDTPYPHTPDSIFPNNWVSFHHDGRVVLYPMFAKNRRLERKPEVLERLEEKFKITAISDLSHHEQHSIFLEGTGSMVLDREKKLAFACLSPRTNERILHELCALTGYTPVSFHALDQNGSAIYHTNVMMCVADDYAVICMDSIRNPEEKQKILAAMEGGKKEVIEITYPQMNHFAGNMLQLQNEAGKKFLVMSSQAYHSLSQNQIEQLTAYNDILHSAIDTIETNGGGSARCMMAEVFLPLK